MADEIKKVLVVADDAINQKKLEIMNLNTKISEQEDLLEDLGNERQETVNKLFVLNCEIKQLHDVLELHYYGEPLKTEQKKVSKMFGVSAILISIAAVICTIFMDKVGLTFKWIFNSYLLALGFSGICNAVIYFLNTIDDRKLLRTTNVTKVSNNLDDVKNKEKAYSKRLVQVEEKINTVQDKLDELNILKEAKNEVLDKIYKFVTDNLTIIESVNIQELEEEYIQRLTLEK